MKVIDISAARKSEKSITDGLILDSPLDSKGEATHGRMTQPEGLPGRHKLEMYRMPNRAAFEAAWTQRFERFVREQDAIYLPAGATQPFTQGGLCVVCSGDRDFMTDFMFAGPDAMGRVIPAWRERQICACGLNCRQRSCYHILTEGLGLNTNSVIYCTEQTTELFHRIRNVFPHATGSEFLGDSVPLGAMNSDGIRNEDIMRLTYPDASFDCIFTLDVMEHVPDYGAGFREMARCLKSGGKLLITAPFDFGLDRTVVRASINADGTLTHHLPPVYHADPINDQGVLCFNDFGWDILDDLRAAGFPDATLFIYTAPNYGYVGLQYVILATRLPVGAKVPKDGYQWDR